MAIESPSTYAEWFWANSLDAVRARSKQYEDTLFPVVGNLINNLPELDKLPPYLQSFLRGISTPTAPDWDTCWVRFLADLSSGLTQRILGHEIKEFDYHMNSYLQNVLMTPDVANTLMLRKKIEYPFWLERQNSGGLKVAEAKFIYESQKPYPTLPDIITYARYSGDPDGPKEITWNKYDISPDDWDLWEWLSRQKLNTEQVLSLYKHKFFTEEESKTELARLGWRDADRQAVFDLAYTIPNAMLVVQGNLLQEIDEPTILESISRADIHPSYAKLYLDAILTKPAVTDIIAYLLRQDPSLSNMDRELRKIGIHSNYFPLYKELAYQIPPIADIITMAVREAFTPEIASKFGQYEGLPQEFVTWVGKKGLTKEWAERYWAAHWTLPSPQQGFEMLHRGVINRDELYLLLRALDIMPFWRDKLIQISYVPLTRVDIRRMHAMGILNNTEVKQAYKDIGYNDLNAQRLTDFTIKLTESSLAALEKKKAK